MKKLLLVGLLLVGPLGWSGSSAQEAGCEPDGDVRFLCGPVSPEDFAPIPDTPWVIVASMVDGGGLHLADIRDHSSDVVFPTATSEPRHDTTTYAACPGPVTRNLRPHGLYLRRGPTRASVGECIRDGQCEGVGSHVARVDLDAMTAERVVDYPSNDRLILGTVAIQVGDEIWVGGVAEGNRIARFPAP